MHSGKLSIMVLPGHIAGGYLAARAVLFLTHATFAPAQATALVITGTLAGELPDIDLIFFYFNQRSASTKKVGEHRDYITHAPLFWLVISLIIVGIGWAAGSAFVRSIGWMILAGTLSHFILDSIEDGVRWLWPFTGRRFFMMKAPVAAVAIPDPAQRETEPPSFKSTLMGYWDYITGAYLHKWTFYAEVIITVAGLWALLK